MLKDPNETIFPESEHGEKEEEKPGSA